MVDQVPSEFYIDESGNTGDLSTVKIDAYFSEQRMFALAAFGGSLDETFIGRSATSNQLIGYRGRK